MHNGMLLHLDISKDRKRQSITFWFVGVLSQHTKHLKSIYNNYIVFCVFFLKLRNKINIQEDSVFSQINVFKIQCQETKFSAFACRKLMIQNDHSVCTIEFLVL